MVLLSSVLAQSDTKLRFAKSPFPIILVPTVLVKMEALAVFNRCPIIPALVRLGGKDSIVTKLITAPVTLVAPMVFATPPDTLIDVTATKDLMDPTVNLILMSA